MNHTIKNVLLIALAAGLLGQSLRAHSLRSKVAICQAQYAALKSEADTIKEENDKVLESPDKMKRSLMKALRQRDIVAKVLFSLPGGREAWSQFREEYDNP